MRLLLLDGPLAKAEPATPRYHQNGGPERAHTSKYGPPISGGLLPLSNNHACWRQLILIRIAKTDRAILG
jgi:hypothetical protein